MRPKRRDRAARRASTRARMSRRREAFALPPLRCELSLARDALSALLHTIVCDARARMLRAEGRAVRARGRALRDVRRRDGGSEDRGEDQRPRAMGAADGGGGGGRDGELLRARAGRAETRRRAARGAERRDERTTGRRARGARALGTVEDRVGDLQGGGAGARRSARARGRRCETKSSGRSDTCSDW